MFVFFLGCVVASPFLPVGCWDDSWQKFTSFISFGFGILKVRNGGEEVLEYEFHSREISSNPIWCTTLDRLVARYVCFGRKLT
jgi:hypothetical protein